MTNSGSLVHVSRQNRLAAVWGPTLLVLAFGALAYWANLRERQSRRAVMESYQVIETLQVMVTRLVDAETGQRGFLLTGRTEYIRPYLHAKSDVQRYLNRVRTLTRSHPNEQARLDSLAFVVGAKFEELEETIALRQSGSLADVLPVISSDRGMRTMARARELTTTIRQDEVSQLANRNAREARSSSALALILVLGSLIAAGVSLVLNRLMDRYATTQERIARDLELTNDQLQEQTTEVELQAEQLQEQAAELHAQNEQLVQLADELEARTAVAETANRAKADFLAAMSHDLRTPLNAITGYVDLLEGGVRGPINDAQIKDLQRIKSSSHRLLVLITDILDFARLEAGKLDVNPQPVRVDTILSDLEASFAPQIAARGLTYSYEKCDPGIIVEADADRVQQILINLITNAIKFTAPPGEITLSVDVAPDDTVLIQVADTGMGIPAERLSDIFHEFVQVDRNPAGRQGSVGLGLAISRKLAAAMGGDLTAESTEGAGSRFTLHLRRAAHANPQEHQNTEEYEQPFSGSTDRNHAEGAASYRSFT